MTDNGAEEIKNKMSNIEILEKISIESALQFKCKLGGRDFNLFSVILGETNCIDEEYAKVLNQKLHVGIPIPDTQGSNERKQLKRDIQRVKKKDRRRALRESNIRELEQCFPNLCAVFKKVEEEF
ncbi:MAG: hypothetical protein ACTSR8_16955 [Promethearchaeota archaeon]